jgi:hypothetical protein
MSQYATIFEMEQARELVLHHYPFTQVKKIVSRLHLVKSGIDVDKAACYRDIRHFPTKLIALPSCCNKIKHNFVKCSCIKRLENQDGAVVTVQLSPPRQRNHKMLC